MADCPLFVAKKLSPRELEALGYAALGYTSKGIARKLSIAERTAKQHLQAAREALGARNTTHAVAIALKMQIIRLETVTAL